MLHGFKPGTETSRVKTRRIKQPNSRSQKLTKRQTDWQPNEIEQTKHTTQQITIMKLVHYYNRPNLFTPALDRLSDLFEAPLRGWLPALDVQEDKDNFTVRVDLPGFKREDIDVSLEDGTVTISGERKGETVAEGTEVHVTERYHGKFSRSITLSATVAAENVKAQYKDGVLTVTLAKAEAAKPKQIKVGE
jgi:HSP20 family molecular chaperone IbpA